MSDLTEMVDEVKETEVIVLPEEETPELMDKQKQAYEYKLRGVPASHIAKQMNVSTPTIYRWWARYEQRFANSWKAKQRADLLFERIIFVQAVRDMTLQEVNQIDIDNTHKDSAGKITRLPLDPKTRSVKANLLKLAMEAENTVFNMLLKTGVLPSAIKEIHCSVDDTAPGKQAKTDDREKTPAELAQSVAKLLKNTRMIVTDAPLVEDIEVSSTVNEVENAGGLYAEGAEKV